MEVLFYYLPFLETIRDFMELGGPVLRVIGVVTLFMWLLIIERIVYMRTGHRRRGMHGPITHHGTHMRFGPGSFHWYQPMPSVTSH
jgi:hypothetical protein